jgi:hypothetical protein
MQKHLPQLLAAIVLSLATFLIAALGWANEQSEQEKRELYLRGNEMWGHYCSSCHNAPPPASRSPDTWDTVTMHMQTRANIPAEQMRAILEYLRSR